MRKRLTCAALVLLALLLAIGAAAQADGAEYSFTDAELDGIAELLRFANTDNAENFATLRKFITGAEYVEKDAALVALERLLSYDTAARGNAEAIADALTEKTGKEYDVGYTPGEEQADVQSYVINTNTKRFHRTNCDSVNDMSKSNLEVSYLTREELIEQGYQPCKKCWP